MFLIRFFLEEFPVNRYSLKVHTFFLSIPLGDFLTPLPRGRVFDLPVEESLALAKAGKKGKQHTSEMYKPS